jgi:hypothetical protein
MQKFLMALTVAALVSCVNSADASMIVGSQWFSVTEVAGLDQNGLSTTSLVDMTTFTSLTLTTLNTADIGQFNSIPIGTAITVPAFDLAHLTDFLFGTASVGTFDANSASTSLATSSQTSSASRTFFFLGDFAPGSVFAGAFQTGAASFSLTLMQTGGSTAPIGGLATLTSPPDPTVVDAVTPEPASIAMFGTMLVPLALGAFRRRQKAAQAAV